MIFIVPVPFSESILRRYTPDDKSDVSKVVEFDADLEIIILPFKSKTCKEISENSAKSMNNNEFVGLG